MDTHDKKATQQQKSQPRSTIFELSEASDTILMLRAADGDTVAFAHIARRYAPMMRSYAFRFTHNEADADDIVQEALTSAWENIASVNKPEAVRSWLMKTTAHKAIDLLRAKKHHASIDYVEPPTTHLGTPDKQVILNEGMDNLSDAIDLLPQSQRQVWLMREIGDMSYAEIAHELGISATAVRGRLARARQTLIDAMEGWR